MFSATILSKDKETLLFDGLGSERTVTNSGQSVTASLTLSAFGQSVASTGSSSSPYQYGATSGYRSDGDAGLTLVGCRYYDAQVGRFITRDTYLDQAPYAYCDGDPVNCVDPSGHQEKKKLPKPGSLEYRKMELKEAEEWEQYATDLAYVAGVSGTILLIPGVGEIAAPIALPTTILCGIYAGVFHLFARLEKYDATH